MPYSREPLDLSKVSSDDIDKEMLRYAVWIELDTINVTGPPAEGGRTYLSGETATPGEPG